MQLINARAAAADIGSESIYVSIAGEAPKKFGTFTRNLEELRDHLVSNQVETIAMEFTGVYWMPLYELLEKTAIKVFLVNGAHVKHLPGRKTDVSDSQWLAELHAHGLLKAGFVPGPQIRKLRDYMRLRDNHIAEGGGHIQQMQKALELMNIKVHDVISDLTGVSGQQMIEAILGGERDPEALLKLCHQTIQKNKAQRMRDALQGTWAKQHLFALKQAWDAWHFRQKQIAECDEQLSDMLQEMTQGSTVDPKDLPPEESKGKRPGKNAPKIVNFQQMLLKALGGRNPAQIPGLTAYTVLQLVSEVGTDLSAFPSEKQFTSWLGLAPGNHSSGKRKRNYSRKGGRAGQVFRNIAQSVGKSTKLGLGLFYRRIRSRKGGMVASKALGRKIAELYYRVMTQGMKFVEEGLEAAQRKYDALAEKRLHREATQRGYSLIPQSQPQPA